MKTFMYVIIGMTFFSSLMCGAEDKYLGIGSVKVESIIPSDGNTDVSPDGTVEVRFSDGMDTNKTISAFSLTSTEGKVPGYFSWNNGDKLMIFHPAKSLKGGQEYIIEIDQTAEDKDGNDLDENYRSVFYINADISSPEIVSYSPANASIGVDRMAHVIIEFSERMDTNSAFDGVVINPVPEAAYTWSNNNTRLEIAPYGGFKNGTTYSVTLGTALQDAAGNNMRSDVSYQFTVGDDFIVPNIDEVRQEGSGVVLAEESTVAGIEKIGSFIVTFDDLMDVDSFNGNILFTPSVNTYYTTATVGDHTVLTVHLLDKLDPQIKPADKYSLTLKRAISDQNGNTLVHDYRYYFNVNGTQSIRPRVLSMTYSTLWTRSEVNLPTALERWTHDEIMTITETDVIDGVLSNVYIIFSEQMKAETVSITLETLLGSGSTVLNPEWYPIEGTPYRVYSIDMDGFDSGKILKITVKDTATDLDGNTMGEEYSQIIRY
jgi:hypothetical protein